MPASRPEVEWIWCARSWTRPVKVRGGMPFATRPPKLSIELAASGRRDYGPAPNGAWAHQARLGRSQVARQRILIPPFPGSSPGAPANDFNWLDFDPKNRPRLSREFCCVGDHVDLKCLWPDLSPLRSCWPHAFDVAFDKAVVAPVIRERCSIRWPVDYTPPNPRKCAMSPRVDELRSLLAAPPTIGTSSPASSLPSSTPHWS